jgi:hypothetical protein
MAKRNGLAVPFLPSHPDIRRDIVAADSALHFFRDVSQGLLHDPSYRLDLYHRPR